MSSVFSIDSDGIRNACTTKVMTNTAMTIVVASDCSELMPPECLLAGSCFPAGWGSRGITVTCGSVLTSLMTAQKIRRQDRGRFPQNLLLMIVDTPRPFVQPPVPQA